MLGIFENSRPVLPSGCMIAATKNGEVYQTRSYPRFPTYPQGASSFEGITMPDPMTLRLNNNRRNKIVISKVADVSRSFRHHDNQFILTLLIDGIEKEYIYENDTICLSDMAAVIDAITPESDPP